MNDCKSSFASSCRQRLQLLRGVTDYYFRKTEVMEKGPFNGQDFRCGIMSELISMVGFNGVVETGTGLGVSTEYLSENIGVPVYSCELNPRRYSYCCLRLRKHSNISLFNLDSASFLEILLTKHKVPRERILFYLDAHWGSYLPLADEIEFICRNWRDSVIVIDDFKVPDDEAYGYDSYGTHTLGLEYLEPLGRFWQIAFPVCPGDQETGAKRGAVILSTKGENVADLAGMNTLRLFVH